MDIHLHTLKDKNNFGEFNCPESNSPSKMFIARSLWKRPWVSDPHKAPSKDERALVAESLLTELDYHVKEFEKAKRDQEMEDKRKASGVDYTWLISVAPKSYEVPQMQRLELEDLCFKVRPEECGKIISLFRDSLLREPDVAELSQILKACIFQVIEHRPKEESLGTWAKRTMSLTNLLPHSGKGNPKVTPLVDEEAKEHKSSSNRSSTSTNNTQVTVISLPDLHSPNVESLPV